MGHYALKINLRGIPKEDQRKGGSFVKQIQQELWKLPGLPGNRVIPHHETVFDNRRGAWIDYKTNVGWVQENDVFVCSFELSVDRNEVTPERIVELFADCAKRLYDGVEVELVGTYHHVEHVKAAAKDSFEVVTK